MPGMEEGAADSTPVTAALEPQQQPRQQQEEEHKEHKEQEEQQQELSADQPSGFVGETQTQTQPTPTESEPTEADSQSQEETKEQVTEANRLSQEETAELASATASEEEKQAEQQQEEEAVAPRFEAPSPPRERQEASAPVAMSAPPPPPPQTQPPAPARTARYSYADLKHAQWRCEGRMVETALLECRDASRAQQEIFRAHVTDLCANIFAAALRKYNPESKEDVESVDPEVAAKVAEIERRVKAKKTEVVELRKQVPRLAAVSTRQQLVSERKRNADVLVTAPEETDEVEMTDVDVEAMRDAYVKTSTTIANATTRLSQVVSETTETIHMVEQAIKRPKTSMDKAMEHSPLKTTVLLTDQEMASDEHPSTLRTRLAMHLSVSKSL